MISLVVVTEWKEKATYIGCIRGTPGPSIMPVVAHFVVRLDRRSLPFVKGSNCG